MELERVYKLLTKVGVDAALQLEAPSGGLVQVRTLPSTGELQVRCSEASAVRDLLQVARAIGTPSFTIGNLRRLRSPLVQTVKLHIGDDALLTWRPEKYPKVHSLRLLIKLLSSK